MRNLVLIFLFLAFASYGKVFYVFVPKNYPVSQKDTTYLDSISSGSKTDTFKMYGYKKDSLFYRYKWVMIDAINKNSFPSGVTVYTLTP